MKAYFINGSCVNLMNVQKILGTADEWIEHKQFMPSFELCAAKVSTPKLEELKVLRMPVNLGNVHDEVCKY